MVPQRTLEMSTKSGTSLKSKGTTAGLGGFSDESWTASGSLWCPGASHLTFDRFVGRFRRRRSIRLSALGCFRFRCSISHVSTVNSISICLSISLIVVVVYSFSVLFWPAPKKAEERNSTHAPHEHLFFSQGERPRRRSRKEHNRRSKMTPKIHTTSYRTC